MEKYIQAVIKYLPVDTREDVQLELKSNIYDMLPENPTEDDIVKVLESLGNPSDLAMEYTQNKRYLIGPAVYDKYIQTMKLVLTIVANAFVAIICMKWIFTTDGLQDFGTQRQIGTLIAEIISGVFEGVLQAAFWVTIIFVLIDRNKVLDGQPLLIKRPWKVSDLNEEAHLEKSHIKRGETIVNICFNIVFATLAFVNPNFFPLILTKNSDTLTVQLFDKVSFEKYIPFLVGLFLLAAALGIYKLIKERWTQPIALTNALLNLGACIIAWIMVSDNTLFSTELKDFLSTHFTDQTLNHTLMVCIVVLVGLLVWDSIRGFIKAKK